MKNEKCDWKRKGCLLFIYLVSTTSFFSYAKSGTDYLSVKFSALKLMSIKSAHSSLHQQKTKKYRYSY